MELPIRGFVTHISRRRGISRRLRAAGNDPDPWREEEDRAGVPVPLPPVHRLDKEGDNHLHTDQWVLP